MNLPGAVTLVAVTILTLTLWMTLYRIIRALGEVSFNLGTIVALINAIGRQTDTVTPTLASRSIRPRSGPVTPWMMASAAASPSSAATVANTLATVTAWSTAIAPLEAAAAPSACSRVCSRSLAW